MQKKNNYFVRGRFLNERLKPIKTFISLQISIAKLCDFLLELTVCKGRL